jgi:hypothetical protein
LEGLKLVLNVESSLLLRWLLEARAFWRRGDPEGEREVGEKVEFVRRLMPVLMLRKGERSAGARPEMGEDEYAALVLRREPGVEGPMVFRLPPLPPPPQPVEDGE